MSEAVKRWERFHHQYQESIVTFLCPAQFNEVGWNALLNARSVVEDFIKNHLNFKTSHSPYSIDESSPEIIKKMCQASAQVGIGPMAAIAGVMAEAAVDAMIQAGVQEAVVDNGGDIVLFTKEITTIGIFAGNSPLNNLAFQLDPQKQPLGICTSSGTVGHSFSYGKADAAIVLSHHIALADSAATALGNKVQNKDDLESCFESFESLSDIQGAMVILGDQIALWGDLPEIVLADVDSKLITRERVFS